jgi:hypothetical protein
MNPPPPAPELFGAPVATWALIVSLLSFAIALVALGWQIAKHFLDGGRVRVYLNTAILEPEFRIVTNRSGRFVLQNDDAARTVSRGGGLELAQLVVENPGRIPVTIYSPGLSFSGHGKKDHTISPRTFSTGDAFGPDSAARESVVRLEPYGRVTFLLDYWSLMPKLLEDAPKGQAYVRGCVGVAGRTKRTQKSSWRRRWKITRGMYTAIAGSPSFTPFSVIWREIYPRLPESAKDQRDRHPNSGEPVTRGMLRYMLDEAMSRFEERPERKRLSEALEELASNYGDKFPVVGIAVYEAYEALDRMDGHLTEWTEGLFGSRRKRRQVEKSSLAVEGERSEVDDPLPE